MKISNFLQKLSATVILCSLSLHAYALEDKQPIKDYVQHVIDQGYNILLDKSLSPEERRNKSASVIRENLHLDWMGRYTLGRYRKNLSPQKLDEFIKVYSDYVVKAYADLSKNYNGQKVAFLDVKELDKNIYLVNTKIINPNSTDYLKVDYLVHAVNVDNKVRYMVGDIITEGVSILNSQQSEFRSVLASSNIDFLIQQLQQKAVKTSKK